MHSHPRNVVYYLSDAKLRLTTADGKVEDRTVKAGTAAWSDGTVHAVENIGSSELLEVQFELKAQDNAHGSARDDAAAQPASLDLTGFAKRYAAAWSNRHPARLAAFYAEDGSLIVNGGPPATGRTAIAAKAQSFMTPSQTCW